MYSKEIPPKPAKIEPHSWPTCVICGVCLFCVEQFDAKHNKEKHDELDQQPKTEG